MGGDYREARWALSHSAHSFRGPRCSPWTARCPGLWRCSKRGGAQLREQHCVPMLGHGESPPCPRGLCSIWSMGCLDNCKSSCDRLRDATSWPMCASGCTDSQGACLVHPAGSSGTGSTSAPPVALIVPCLATSHQPSSWRSAVLLPLMSPSCPTVELWDLLHPPYARIFLSASLSSYAVHICVQGCFHLRTLSSRPSSRAHWRLAFLGTRPAPDGRRPPAVPLPPLRLCHLAWPQSAML